MSTKDLRDKGQETTWEEVGKDGSGDSAHAGWHEFTYFISISDALQSKSKSTSPCKASQASFKPNILRDPNLR